MGAAMASLKRTFRRGGPGRGVVAATLAGLYLSLTLSALTCALHHDISGTCPHHGGAMAHAMAAMDHGSHGAPPDPATGSAHAGLCKCLDKLAAEPPDALAAAALTPPATATDPAPAAAPPILASGPARTRAPPAPFA